MSFERDRTRGRGGDHDVPDAATARPGKQSLTDQLDDDPIDLGQLATVTVTAEPEPIETTEAELGAEIEPRPLEPLPRLQLGGGQPNEPEVMCDDRDNAIVDGDADDAPVLELGELANVTVKAEPEPIETTDAQVSTELSPRPEPEGQQEQEPSDADGKHTQEDLQLDGAIPENHLPKNAAGQHYKPTISGDKIGKLRITSAFNELGSPHSVKKPSKVIGGDGKLVQSGQGRRNLGIDYVPVGTKQIHAWFPGTVAKVIRGQKDGTTGASGYGNRAIVRTDLFYKLGDQYHQVWCHYAHCESVAVEQNQHVAPGDVIGIYGNTGGSHGAHVDFRTWIQSDQGKIDISPSLLTTRKSGKKPQQPTRTKTETQTTKTETTARKPTKGKPGSLKLGGNETYREALLLAQQRTGIDAAALAAMIDAEAAKTGDKWNAASHASGSTAVGLTQFIEGTWLQMATRPGTLLNERALDKGFVQRVGKKMSVVDRGSLLALRTDPVLAIVSAAEYGTINLAAMSKDGVVPGGVSDDERAHYMYIGHHEGSAGAVIHYTDSATCSEDQAATALKNFKDGRALRKQFSTAREAYRVFAERFSRGKFPAQVKGGKNAAAIIQRYLDANGGSWEQAYRAWLRDYATKKIQPDRFREPH